MILARINGARSSAAVFEQQRASALEAARQAGVESDAALADALKFEKILADLKETTDA